MRAPRIYCFFMLTSVWSVVRRYFFGGGRGSARHLFIPPLVLLPKVPLSPTAPKTLQARPTEV